MSAPRFGAPMAPLLGNRAVELAAKAERAIAAGQAAGLSEAEAREVMKAWSDAYAATPLSWAEANAAMLRRATGEEWRP